jgi:hypothetical protein
MNSSDMQFFLVGIGAILWAICLNHNDVVFNKILISSFMQVIFRGIHWTRTWVNYQNEAKRKTLQVVCQLIEIMTMEIFTNHECWSINRLSF